MQYRPLWLAVVALRLVAAQTTSESDTRAFTTLTGLLTTSATGTYDTDTSQVTATQTTGLVNQQPSSSASSGTSRTGSDTTTTTSPGSTSTITLLLGGGVGLQTLSVINGTTTIFPNATVTPSRSSTSSSAQPTNTQPCNGYPEFCNRKYSNITEVAAHNAAFVVKGNAASNQEFGVTQQLDDGIRMITGETQYVNDTFYNCHTSCDLLNAGPYVNELTEIAAWVKTHPYDVVTILIVNSNFRPVEDYVDVIQSSGLSPYLYTPPYIPMHLDDWPTLGQMILTQKRVVIFMDYNANQTSVPYILDEFSQIWETPFSPEDINFPCTVQRPPQLTNATEARDEFMYLANHNLNIAISFAGTSFLIPNTAEINNTNAAGNDTGMLGRMADTCQQQWDRPPNFLLVDYYDKGSGSVFEVAAKMNNVTYNDRPCCGIATSDGERRAYLNAGLIGAAIAVAIAMTMA